MENRRRPAVQLPDAAWLSTVRRKAVRWYNSQGRDLPWRATRDPYKIWVSEVMLQQTQVETVIPYYHRFLLAFPTIRRLAAASEREVLRQWEGLGYYRRARQLHAAARHLTQHHRGRFPSSFDQVLALPGIGRYTAGAIMSFAYDQPHPILEGNTLRLYTRLIGYDQDATRTAGQRLLWALAEALLPRQQCATTNQALMELGSQVCKARRPACLECPLRGHCRAFEAGLQLQLPNTGNGVEYTSIREAAVVVRQGGRVLLRQCQADERWAGLWDFPRFAVAHSGGSKLREEVAWQLKQAFNVDVTVGDRLLHVKHAVTRYRITLTCFEGHYDRSPSDQLPEFTRWVTPSGLRKYPLSTTGRRISQLLSRKCRP